MRSWVICILNSGVGPEVVISNYQYNRFAILYSACQNALARLPRALMASGQACEAGGRLRRLKNEILIMSNQVLVRTIKNLSGLWK
ncbi:MAG: hypothetical protein BBJ57_04345 [Desulfobacterales bacterium PC51MH44]|nr:MAG: hypothetical protein BBJ57_04345 [Desulfobacterales bacterium PC51MH44]